MTRLQLIRIIDDAIQANKTFEGKNLYISREGMADYFQKRLHIIPKSKCRVVEGHEFKAKDGISGCICHCDNQCTPIQNECKPVKFYIVTEGK